MEELAYNVVLILSNGVTASNDSVTPAPKPAMTVRGPEMWPFSSCSMDLNWSNATKRTPAFRELPIISVVQPAYHAGPNFGHGSLSAPDSRWLSCVRVLATIFLSIFLPSDIETVCILSTKLCVQSLQGRHHALWEYSRELNAEICSRLLYLRSHSEGFKRTFSRVGDSCSCIVSPRSKNSPPPNSVTRASCTYKFRQRQHWPQLSPSGERLASPCASPAPSSWTPSALIYLNVTTLCD